MCLEFRPGLCDDDRANRWYPQSLKRREVPALRVSGVVANRTRPPSHLFGDRSVERRHEKGPENAALHPSEDRLPVLWVETESFSSCVVFRLPDKQPLHVVSWLIETLIRVSD